MIGSSVSGATSGRGETISNVMRGNVSGCDAGSNVSSKEGGIQTVSKSPRSKIPPVTSRKRASTKVSDGMKMKTSIAAVPGDGSGQKAGPEKKPKVDGLITSPSPQQNLLFEVRFLI